MASNLPAQTEKYTTNAPTTHSSMTSLGIQTTSPRNSKVNRLKTKPSNACSTTQPYGVTFCISRAASWPCTSAYTTLSHGIGITVSQHYDQHIPFNPRSHYMKDNIKLRSNILITTRHIVPSDNSRHQMATSQRNYRTCRPSPRSG